MASICGIMINGVEVPPAEIMSCFVRESILGVPDGEVIISDQYGVLDEIIRIPTFSKINVKIFSYVQDHVDVIPDTNKIDFDGIITNVVVSDVDHSAIGGISRTIKIFFIYDDGNRSLMSILKSSAYIGNSSEVIGAICKNSNIKFKNHSVVGNDYMKWLICNKNAYQAISAVAERSFVSVSDALLNYITLDGTVNVASLNHTLNNPRNIVYTYSRGDFQMNIPLPYENNENIKAYRFNSYSSIHSGIKASLGGYINSEISDITGNNKSKFENNIKKSNSAISSTLLNNTNNTIGHVNAPDATSNFFKNRQIISSSINTHANYGVAPFIRESIFSRFSNMVNLVSSGESDTKIGDCVNIFFPSNIPTIKIQEATSGRYLITDRIHEYNRANKIYINKTFAIKDFLQYDKKTYYEVFGISEKEVA